MLFRSGEQFDSRHRVVVTGAGIVTSLGQGWESNAAGFRHGRTAFSPIEHFDTSRHRVKSAGLVTFSGTSDTGSLSRSQRRRLDRASKLLLAAGLEAWNASGWHPNQVTPLILGTTSGGMNFGEAFYRTALNHSSRKKLQATRVSNYLPQTQASDLLQAIGFKGPVTIISNACAAGANAIGHAFELVQSGRNERVFAGGYDAISEMVFTGFDTLKALSPTCCRPFDANRDGLSLGEGAAMLTLETLQSARQREAKIFGEILGYGASTDSHHLTQPHPQGNAALLSMEAACAKAGVTPRQVGYINAHGTGTPLNDSAEATAINRWRGDSKVRVSSTKAGIGHLLGAAGAVEAVVCLMALTGQWYPPTSTLISPDPAATFDIVSGPSDAIKEPLEHALTNSFGFGGANASLLFRRWG
ncbi:MAG: beta-ketoacyl-[acyl-carrier-protein] synthase family protein [Verrucomicrobiota bacterium]|nr:beta-ketoacyl-[acyl-carrier-protein] synthase family protein [Verrucomicrobiota bacterium]